MAEVKGEGWTWNEWADTAPFYRVDPAAEPGFIGGDLGELLDYWGPRSKDGRNREAVVKLRTLSLAQIVTNPAFRKFFGSAAVGSDEAKWNDAAATVIAGLDRLLEMAGSMNPLTAAGAKTAMKVLETGVRSGQDGAGLARQLSTGPVKQLLGPEAAKVLDSLGILGSDTLGLLLSAVKYSNARPDADAYLIKYRTRLAHPTSADPLGATADEQREVRYVPATGMVLVPRKRSPYPVRPLVLFTPGTHGNAVRCSPSMRMVAGDDYESFKMNMLLDKGFAVVITDYAGVGLPYGRPYTTGPTLAMNALDAVRAAHNLGRALPSSGIPVGGPWAVWGYSEGGMASSWTASLQQKYAPELGAQLVGTATGGIAPDLGEVATWMNGLPFMGMVLSCLSSAPGVYPDVRPALESGLTHEALKRVDEMRHEGLWQLVPRPLPKLNLAGISRPGGPMILDRPELQHCLWQTSILRSELYSPPVGKPLFMYHSRMDPLLPFEATLALRNRWAAQGHTIEWTPQPAGDHMLALIMAAPRVTDWLQDRFAGKPVVSNNGERTDDTTSLKITPDPADWKTAVYPGWGGLAPGWSIRRKAGPIVPSQKNAGEPASPSPALARGRDV